MFQSSDEDFVDDPREMRRMMKAMQAQMTSLQKKLNEKEGGGSAAVVEVPPFDNLKTDKETDEAIKRYFSDQDRVDKLEEEIKADLRKAMANETEEQAARRLPGRVIEHLLSLEIQEERAWPGGWKVYKKPLPSVLVQFARRLIGEVGVEPDAEVDKRIKAKFSDAAWKKGLREAEQRKGASQVSTILNACKFN